MPRKIPSNVDVPSRNSAYTWISPEGEHVIWFPGHGIYRVSHHIRVVRNYTGSQEAVSFVKDRFGDVNMNLQKGVVMKGVNKWAYRRLCTDP